MKSNAVLVSFAVAALCVHACGGSSESGLFGKETGGSAGNGATMGSGVGGNAGSPGLGGAGGAFGANGRGGAGGTLGAAGSSGLGGAGATTEDGSPMDAGGTAGDADGSAGASGTGTGGTGGSGGVAPGASVECGGTTCESGQGAVCCRQLAGGAGGALFTGFGGSGFGGGGGGTTCNSNGMCTGMGTTRIRCDGPEDCAANSACCAAFTTFGTSQFYSELSCRPVADCGGMGRRIVCDPAAADPCPNGGSCQTAPGLPASYEVCR